MVHLTLAGLSQDKRRLLLVSDAGVEFTLDVDGRLRAALRGEVDRIGQLEITMESTLRPRDIQSRIRAGATPEAVAEAAQTSVEKIMAFAGPVLAERAHIVQRAQASSVRRRAGESGGARTLGDAVTSHLSGEGTPADAVEWDSWRRDDGRWTLTAVYPAGKKQSTATYTFDVRGSYVVAEDDNARWLIGEAPPAAPATGRRDDLQSARRRRAGRVSISESVLDLGDQPPYDLLSDLPLDDPEAAPNAASASLGDDAMDLVDDSPTTATGPATWEAEGLDREPTVDLSDVRHAASTLPRTPDSPTPPDAVDDVSVTDAPTEPATGDEVAGGAPDERPEAATDGGAAADDVPPTDAPTDAPADPPPATRRPARKNRGRASVPSWDEIMFGGGRPE
ncbi:septation protein SepH [Nocardioides alkalitolerans]|uniref:septation protein SepH n=1 Tax=Nocardioides alkalitolerans TaxID=281714 RepID=UPI000423E179|nr:septation protein SepH [Nocardioides alkalitolerans]